MLISVEGAHALEDKGATKTADLVRRTDSSKRRDPDAIRKIVASAIFELDMADFYIVMKKIDDVEAIFQTFIVLGPALRVRKTTDDIVCDVVNDLDLPTIRRLPGEDILHTLLTALIAPWVVLRDFHFRRWEVRNQDWLRRYFVTKLLEAGDDVLRNARGSRHLFTPEEYDRLMCDVRLGLEKAA